MPPDVTPPDVAILLPDLRGGGVERIRVRLADAFAERGLAVEFVLMRKRGEWLSMVPNSVTVVDFGVDRVREALVPLAKYLRRRRPAALLAAMWPLTSLAIWARALARVPTRVIVSEHNDFSVAPLGISTFGRFKLQYTMRLSYPMAEGVVAVSCGVAETVSRLADLPRDGITVIHNPVNPPAVADYEAPCVAAKAWAAHDGPRLLAIGSFKEQKNFALLLSAFAKVRCHAKARLLILGEGHLRSVLEELRDRLGVEGLVDMPGFVPNPYPYLARADLFILSSAWEGFGNVIVEALACGTPVVSTDCQSGPREILADGRYGRLVPVGDIDALAAAILISLSEDHDKRALVSRSGEFSVEKAANAYISLLLPAA